MKTSARPSIGYRWQFAVALAVAFASIRVFGVLGPRELRWLLPLGFTLMALTPYLLLDAASRREMGLRRPATARIYLAAIVTGAAAALACFAIGFALFGAGVGKAYLRTTSGSLLPAIASHACFNLVMNITIFGFLWAR